MPKPAQVADNVFETDVLVIGGGTGGLATAIRARQEGASTLVVEKAGIRGGGSLGASPNSLHVIWPEKTSFAETLEREKQAIDGLVNTKALRIFYEDSLARTQDLEKWGCPVMRTENGEMYQRPILGNLPHVFMVDPIKKGPKRAMIRQARANKVKFQEWTMISNLLIQDGRVAGATGFNVRTGKFTVFKAGATVLATGTGIRLYRPASGNSYVCWHPPYCTGDGHAMAYRAGAELTNMEIPCFTMAVQGLASYLALEILYMPYCEAPLINRLGERFLTKYDPELVEMTSRNVFCQGILDQYEAGLGPCFIDTSKMSPKALDEWRRGAKRGPAKLLLQYLDAQGIELGKDLVEIGLTEPILYNGGVTGCYIDEQARTNVPGLYAIGDVASGTAIRGITGAICAGWRAGGDGARVAAQLGPVSLDAEAVARERERALAPMKRQRGIRPKELERRLNDVMSDYVGYRRTGEGLRTAIGRLQQLRGQIGDLVAENPHELLKAHEVQNLIDCGEMVAQAACFREESRCPPFHFRADFPQKDDANWLAFAVVRKDGNRMALSKRPVG